MNIDLIIGVAGVIGSIAAIVLALRKYPYESRNMDASAAKAYAEAAKSSADRAKEIADEWDAYRKQSETQIENLEKEVRELKISLKVRQEELENLRDWAERLVHQVQSLGAVPVAMKNRK